MGASLYDPINVYKPIAPAIGIVDGPFEYLTVGGATLPLPFTTRMTVVRLPSDSLFLHSPIKFDEGLARELQRIGEIRHLVSPNQFHYAHISGSGRKPFPMRSHGHHRSCVRERALGTSMSRLRETSTSIHQKNGGKTSTRRYFRVGISKSSFSFTRNRRRWFLRTRLSTSSWIRCRSLGERRQSSAGCIIPAGRYSLACGFRSCCSGGRQRRHSQKSTVGNPSASCSVMAGVLNLEATKSSGGFSESRSLESEFSPSRRTAIFHPLATCMAQRCSVAFRP
ncbi:hypothetical protein V1272_001203 [Bradyrhizobium sp. AZCC 1708]